MVSRMLVPFLWIYGLQMFLGFVLALVNTNINAPVDDNIITVYYFLQTFALGGLGVALIGSAICAWWTNLFN